MKNKTLHSQLLRLRHLINTTAEATSCNIEIQSHWACYLCVLAAGFIENTIEELFTCYIKGKTNEKISRFAIHHIGRVYTPKFKTIVATAGLFSTDWAKSIEDFSNIDGSGSAVNSIMNNRHNIAHGQNSSITVSQLQDYLNRSVKLLEHIETICQ